MKLVETCARECGSRVEVIDDEAEVCRAAVRVWRVQHRCPYQIIGGGDDGDGEREPASPTPLTVARLHGAQ